MRTIEPPVLFNHSVRAYVYGRAVGEAQGLQPGESYDDETFFLACLLHDIGLVEQGDRDQRLEVDGADLAMQFLRENGSPQSRADVVWDSIALHTSPGMANRKGPEVALLYTGARIDINHRWAR